MKASLAAALFVMVLGGNALAQGQTSAPPAMNFQQACGVELQKFCATAQTRRDQHKCIKQNRTQLSPSCSSYVAARRAQRHLEKQQRDTAPAQTPPSH